MTSGKANYAQQPSANGGVDISLTGFTILDGGGGYTAPVVTITDYYNTPGASGVRAMVTLDPITGIDPFRQRCLRVAATLLPS